MRPNKQYHKESSDKDRRAEEREEINSLNSDSVPVDGCRDCGSMT